MMSVFLIDMRTCPKCKKTQSVRAGFRKNKSGLVQKYKCTVCNHFFVRRDGFERMRTKPEIIVCALDMRAKGVSLGKIVDHIKVMYNKKISRKTVLDWEHRFGGKLQTFSNQFVLGHSENTHVDEMFLKKKGAKYLEFAYYWAAIDYDTKFLLAEHISVCREERESEIFLKKVRKRVKDPPDNCHTDNSYDYPKPIRKILGKKTKHIHFPAWKKKFKNNPIERFFNTCREVTKNLRRFTSIENMIKHFQFLTVYYNFLRPHKSLQGKTPAEVAGFGKWTWWSIIKIKRIYVFKLMIS